MGSLSLWVGSAIGEGAAVVVQDENEQFDSRDEPAQSNGTPLVPLRWFVDSDTDTPISRWVRKEHEGAVLGGRSVLVVLVSEEVDRDTEHPTIPHRPLPIKLPKSKSGPVPTTRC
ncbi:hypothetical protein BLNAU_6114 [Blattamonas nauphoetae]|uniref:Uncharacterized protein n=1 Tax=Blattamonas nauphoetae TaxID=2049346 RepID=A0ABQ9Y5A0_9EUKA|nr:hypothetical protein BLNAU_6114 [Blattamonas nauphoetae]